MGKMMRLLAIVFAAILVLVLAYLVFRGIASWKQGYSWKEMDWHQRGKTSIADFFAASDIGKREIKVDGKSCIEYYAYKDGLPVKTVCPK
jgi:hypothetical protein